MKVRILGCGTSTGVPKIGNEWGRCDPEEPRNRRLRSSILVESAGAQILVDCGPDLRQQLLERLAAQLRDEGRRVGNEGRLAFLPAVRDGREEG